MQKEDLKYDGSLGIFTATALILLFWAFCWLKSYAPFNAQQNIKVLFPQIAGLNENADVYVDGVKVGCVAKINWLAEKKVLVSLRIIKPKVVIRQGARFDILTNGLVGAKYVDVTISDSADLPPLDESMTAVGEKPMRTEIVINKLAGTLDSVDIDRVKNNLDNDRKIFEHAAEKFSVLADKTAPVMDRALPLENEISSLSFSLRRTSKNLDRLLDAEDVSPELKETIRQAHETARDARAAIHELNATVSDRSMRQDLINSVDQFNQAANHLQSSMQMLKELSDDRELREDTKQMLLNARIAMEKLDEIFSDPKFGSDLKMTMQKTRAAVQDIDIAAQQLRQILNKRHPLLHMIFGRPGYIKLGNTEIHPELRQDEPSKPPLLHVPTKRLKNLKLNSPHLKKSEINESDIESPSPVVPGLE